LRSSRRGRATRGVRRLVVVAALVSLIGGMVATAPPAMAEWTPPSLQRSISGTGVPGIFAWGIQYNSFTNEVLVGDYLNFQIRRYDLDGNLIGSFYRTDPDGQPYSLAVDPRNGNILVAELADGGARGIVARYDRNGNFLSRIVLSGMASGNHYHVWLAVDNAGDIWIQDAHYWNNASSPPKVREFSPIGSTSGCTPGPCRSWGTWGSTNGAMGIGYGIALDASNNVYILDSTNKKIHVYTQAGTWIRDMGGPGDGVGQLSGDLRGIAIDRTRGWLYVNDAEAGQVEKFTLTGTPLTNWGSEGTGPGQFADGGRQLTLTPDGDVWSADYGNFRFQRFTSNGTLRGIYPDPAQPPPAGHLAQPRAVAVDSDTGNVYVADTWAQRFQMFAPDGGWLGSWGRRFSQPPYGFDYPRGIAFDDALDRVWVLNTRAHNIRRYQANAAYIDTLGSEQNDSNAPGFFRWPVDAAFFGGSAYIGDYNSGRVKRLDANTGQELGYRSLNNNGVAVDPSTGNVYVVSWTDDRVTVLSPNLQTTIRTFGSRGSGDGQFQNPWGITIVDGVVYVTDSQLSRVQAFDLNGAFLGKWGGYGRGPYQFANPSGIVHDASGNLYIADTANDRIQVYSTTQPKLAGDNRRPTVSITSPVNGSAVPGGTVFVTGSASDLAPFGIAKVDVAIQDNDTGLWWDAKTATWTSTQLWSQAASKGVSITNMTYSFPFVGSDYNRSFTATVRATDVSGIVSATTPSVAFTTAGSTGDQLPPVSHVTAPALDAVVPPGPVVIQGTTGDNVGVTQVQVAVRDRNTNRWFNGGTGQFVNGPVVWNPASVATPGAFETTWSYSFAGGSVGSGAYYATSRALDAAGNIETDTPFTRFDIAGTGDTLAPDTSITTPASGQSFAPGTTIGMNGSASDNTGVNAVQVAIRDVGSGQWWTGSAWGSGQQWLAATVFSPGASTTGWSFTWPAPGIGSYELHARAVDAASNVDSSPAMAPFSVAPSDTSAPTTTLSTPTNGQSFLLGPISISGSASDDVGVTQVRVSIRNNATLQWWNGSTWGAFAYVPATLLTPGGTTTSWSYSFTPSATGSYGIQVRSVDAAGNVGDNTAWRNFTVN
jgi:tripartite motif-containing protein 71